MDDFGLDVEEEYVSIVVYRIIDLLILINN